MSINCFTELPNCSCRQACLGGQWERGWKEWFGRRLLREYCRIHAPLPVVGVLVQPPSCCWHLPLIQWKPKGRRQQKEEGTENRKVHRVWKFLTEKAGALLGSRRHSQVDRAGLSRQKVLGPGKEVRWLFRRRTRRNHRAAETWVQCWWWWGHGEEVGNSHPKKDWWSAAKQRLWELV